MGCHRITYYQKEETEPFLGFCKNKDLEEKYRELKKCDYYYPFGMNINALSSTAPLSKPNRFKFNQGTEFNTDFDFNTYETMFRGYDPQIGRFKQVDPLADMFTDWTPYQYAYNDPIYWSDPLGLANGSGDSTWVSTSQLVQYLWDNTPEDGSATFEIVGFNPYGDEVGRTPTSDGVNIYHEGEFAVQATSRSSGNPNSITTKRTGDELDYYQTLLGSHGLLYGAAENYYQSGSNLWRGSNGKYYSTSWGGNQWTGGRNAVVKTGKFLRVAGQWIAVGGVALDIIDLSQGNINTGQFMSNTTFTAIGVFGGPVGWITSGAYFIMVATGAEERGAQMGAAMAAKREAGLLSHPKAGGWAGRNLPKSRNPKF